MFFANMTFRGWPGKEAFWEKSMELATRWKSDVRDEGGLRLFHLLGRD